MRRLLLAGGTVMLLAGCASAPPASYDLSALQTEQPAGRKVVAQLVVSAPLAGEFLDSRRILVRHGENELAYLPGAEWASRLPEMVQARLVQSFENTHRVIHVARPGGRIVPDDQLDTEIRAFEWNPGTGEAVVEIEAKLINDRTGKIVATQTFRHAAAQSAADPQAVTAGLDAALTEVMKQIIGWTAKSL